MAFFDTIKIVFLYSVRHLLPYLPYSVSAMLADAIGMVSKRGQQARIIKEELGKLFGDKKSESELEDIALKSICNYRKDLFEIWSFPRLNKNKIEKLAYIEGIEHLDKALKKGKGALIGVSHFGSWKIIIPALAYKGYKVNQIGLDPRYFIDDKRSAHHNLAMEMEYKSEQSLPANFIYIGKFLRPIFRALANNEVVIDSFDGFMGSKKIEVPFFNSRLSISRGPVNIAFKSGSPLIPAFAVRQKDNRHRIIIHDELALHSYQNVQKAIENGIKNYVKLLEHYVQEYPSHYGRILYDRFRDPNR
jgi:KDO2-lipid IV(A) lauroyltransferase